MHSAILLALVLAGTPYKPSVKQCRANVGQCNCFAISQVEYKDCRRWAKMEPRPRAEFDRKMARCETDRVRRESACRLVQPPPL